MTRPASPHRRHFLRQAGGLPALALGGPLGGLVASAAKAAPSDYKALVCVFLQGGNDAYNTVLPTDLASWAHYADARLSSGLVLAEPGVAPSAAAGASLHQRLGGVLPLAVPGLADRALALHPALAPMQTLFEDGRLAIVPSVGALVQPLSKADVLGRRVAQPPKLFSHNDQQAMVQAFGVEGARTGWGGLLADGFLSRNQRPEVSTVTLANGAVWGSGRRARSYQLAASGLVTIGQDDGRLVASALAHQQLLKVMTSSRTNSLIAQDHAAVAARALTVQEILRAAMPAAGAGPWGTAGAANAEADPLLRCTDPATGARELNPLAHQLQAVCRLIAARGVLGVQRQVFYVSLDGFDTHNGQAGRHATLLNRLAHAMAYFNRALGSMGVASQVTTFTLSEFGRSFSANGDGTDHGWGSHAFVMGGAVRGGRVHGRFPGYGAAVREGAQRNTFDSEDQLRNGALLPQAAVDQFGATLGRWFGASEATLLEVFPNLGNFATGQRDLGFMA